MNDEDVSFFSTCPADLQVSMNPSPPLSPSSGENAPLPATSELLINEFNKPSRATFNVIHLNMQSLLGHFSEFEALFHPSNKAHAILVSESWLKPSLSDNLVELSDFKLFRNDRENKAAGGVCIYLRQDLDAKVLVKSPSAYNSSTEYIILEICHEKQKLMLGVAYRPPGCCNKQFEEDISRLSPLYQHTLLLGDFNCDLLKNTPESIRFKGGFTSLNLSFCPLQATHRTATSESLLDLIICSNTDRILNFGQFLVPGISFHDLIYACYSLKLPKFKPKIISYRDVQAINMESLHRDAAAVPWWLINSFTSIDDRVSCLNNFILQLYDTHAPVKQKRVSRPPAPWITDEIRQYMSNRDTAFRNYRRSLKTNPDAATGKLELYRTLRNRCNQAIRNAKLRYAHHTLKHRSPKELWKNLKLFGINTSKKSQNVDLSSLSPDTVNNHFCKVPTKPDCRKPIFHRPLRDNGFSLTCVTPDMVLKAINRIKSSATGADGISIVLIKKILPFIISHITQLFNFSLTTGSFPSPWKVARVLPLPKTKIISDADDLRPISILPTLSKALEYLVDNQIRQYIYEHNLLDPYQSGFRKHFSTATALTNITDDVRHAMDNRQVTILTLLDFSKAFQSINHEILLQKLSAQFNFSTSACKWVKNYIIDRKQYVTISNATSATRTLFSGVPQGSVLGPLLFSLYINDLPSYLRHCKYHLYADDVQIYSSCTSTSLFDTIVKINEDLHNILLWSHQNLLSLNPCKSKSMILASQHITASLRDHPPPHLLLNNTPIPYVTSLKDLGVTLNRNLNWTDHIAAVCKKTFGILHSLNRLRNFLPVEIKTTLIHSLIMPHLDYCDTTLTDLDDILSQRLQRVQNASVRFIFNLKRSDHLSPFFSELGWLRLSHRRLLHSLLLLFKTLSSGKPPYLAQRFRPLSYFHDKGTRSCENNILSIPRHNSAFLNKSFSLSTVRAWNSLPNTIRNSSSVGVFKRTLTSYLIRNQDL